MNKIIATKLLKPSVLIIEDGTYYANEVKHYLEDNGFFVMTAIHFNGVVSLMESIHFDYVLMDFNLNNYVDGAQITKIVKEHFPEVKILANSVDAFCNGKIINAGGDDIIGKDYRSLKAWIEQVKAGR